jgi:hypothetical protein
MIRGGTVAHVTFQSKIGAAAAWSFAFSAA